MKITNEMVPLTKKEVLSGLKKLGCNNYFVKVPVFEKFSQTIEQVGHYIKTEILPEMGKQ